MAKSSKSCISSYPRIIISTLISFLTQSIDTNKTNLKTNHAKTIINCLVKTNWNQKPYVPEWFSKDEQKPNSLSKKTKYTILMNQGFTRKWANRHIKHKGNDFNDMCYVNWILVIDISILCTRIANFSSLKLWIIHLFFTKIAGISIHPYKYYALNNNTKPREINDSILFSFMINQKNFLVFNTFSATSD